MAGKPVNSPLLTYFYEVKYIQYREHIIIGAYLLLMVALPISKAVASILMAPLALCGLLDLYFLRISLWDRIKRFPQIMVLSLPFFCYAFSLLYSDNLAQGSKFLFIQNGLLVILLFLVVHAEIIKKYHALLLKTFIITTAVAGCLTLLFYFLPEPQAMSLAKIGRGIGMKEYIQLSKREAFGVYSPFVIRLQFSNLISLSILSALWLLAEKKVNKYMWGWVIILLMTSLVLGGRGGQVGLLVGLGIWAFLWLYNALSPQLTPKLGRYGTGILVGFLSLALVVGGPVLAYKSIPSVQQRYNQLIWELETFYSDSYEQYDYVHFTGIRRILSYQHSWELIQQHPFTGVGVGDYKVEMQAVYDQDAFDFPVNSHNHLLYMWVNTGIIGILLFLVSFGYWALYVWKNGRNHLPAFGLAVMLFFLTIMMFDVLITQIDTMVQPFIMGLIALVCTELGPS
ncbi:MAG: O-antigen ligase family protein [Bacteroidota bacterium]